MKKYWIFQEIPIEFNGTKDELEKFEANNNHLVGCEAKKKDFDKQKAKEKKKETKAQRRREYPPVGDQLDIFWKFFASRRLRAGKIKAAIEELKAKDTPDELKQVLNSLADAIGDLTEEQDVMLAQLEQVKRNNPYEEE